jgi:nicotine blue oxidoreductase
MTGIAAVVLAAGQGRRLGGAKALLKIGNETFLERIVNAIRVAGCEPIVVVGGADSARVGAEAGRLDAIFVNNENWQKGQFSSLRVGLTGIGSVAAAVLVALVDHPLVGAGTYQSILEEFRSSPDRIVIPVCEDPRTQTPARGHPVVIPAWLAREIMVLSDEDTLRDVIRRNAKFVVEKRVEDVGVLKDVDTFADLEDAGASAG